MRSVEVVVGSTTKVKRVECDAWNDWTLRSSVEILVRSEVCGKYL